MNKKIFKKSFYGCDTVLVAQKLIGKVLVVKKDKTVLSGIINETEAYTQEDPACHAYNGKKTKRNKEMFGEPGTVYVYLIYGMYYCLNIVTEDLGRGCAVLLRSIMPLKGLSLMQENRGANSSKNLTNGPGKLCMALSITDKENGLDVSNGKSNIVVIDEGLKPGKILCTPRIGISKGKELKWRFFCNQF